MNKQKVKRFSEYICQNNKMLFVTVNSINACKLEFIDHLWLPFLDRL